MASLVISEFQNGVGQITINRPNKRNALTRQLIEELSSEVQKMKSRTELRLLVLAANGKVFCAGMDLDEMQSRATSSNGKEEWQKDSQVYSELLDALFTFQVPTVVKLQGPVLAGGVGMVLACDLIVASRESFFSLPEPVRGITAAIVTPLLVHRVGPGAATQLLLSGEKMSAERGLQLGLCYDVVTPEELDSRIASLQQSILTGSQSALAITKSHLNQCLARDVRKLLRESIETSAFARETADAREGLEAFLQKRKPSWQS